MLKVRRIATEEQILHLGRSYTLRSTETTVWLGSGRIGVGGTYQRPTAIGREDSGAELHPIYDFAMMVKLMAFGLGLILASWRLLK